ncbi:MAG: outer membrane lipoprotein carrier protein LolA [Syntrophaceae bacterium]|nr:outer membrane lipoprotein carrier protein LolA [Syntrophaceae bacterium]
MAAPLIAAALVLIFAGWADSWDAIRREAGQIRSVRARFVQKKHLPILAKPFVSEGRFSFQAPASVRWEYTKPVRSVLLIHKGSAKRYIYGDKGWVPEAGERLQGMQMVMDEISAWTQGRFDADPRFTARLEGGRPARVVLVPKDPSLMTLIARIEISLSPEKLGAIRSVKIVEGKDAWTMLEFTRTEHNLPLVERIFTQPGEAAP